MLGFVNKRYYFPNLVYVGEANFKSRSEQNTTNIFKLDWSNSEKKKKRNFDKWRENKDIEYVPSCSEYWSNYLDNLLFVIPNNYMYEINRCSNEALREKTVKKQFDTMIRDYCHNITETYIDVAFYLISDCIYDPKTNYFSREHDRRIVKAVMLWKFWAHQIGLGLIEYISKINKIRNYDFNKSDRKDFVNKCFNLIINFDIWSKEIDESYQLFCDYQNEVEDKK
jgi:hypothetical protein